MEPNIELLLSQTKAGPQNVIIGTRGGRVKKFRTFDAQKSLLIRKLSATMPSMRRYRALPAVVFAILVSALVGGLFGRNALATDDKIPEHYQAFSAALSAIEDNYIDKVDSENLVYGAVRGMLGTLDPHSSFFSPKEYAQMRERQEGRYYGLGITIRARPTATSLRSACSRARRRTRRACAAATSSRGLPARTPRGGRPSRRCGSCAARRARRSTSSIKRRGYDELIRLSVTRDEVLHPDGAGRTS